MSRVFGTDGEQSFHLTYGDSYLKGMTETIEQSQLRQEIAGMEALEKQISSSVNAMRARLQQDAYERTFRGRFINGATAVFGVYCIYRVIVVRFSHALLSTLYLSPCRPPDASSQ